MAVGGSSHMGVIVLHLAPGSLLTVAGRSSTSSGSEYVVT